MRARTSPHGSQFGPYTVLERGAADAGSQAIVCDGGEWEISAPAGVRKPDGFPGLH